MIIVDCEQGTPEWLNARIGKPTASQVDRIITPAKLEMSKSRFDYRNQLVAEWLLGYPVDWGDAGGWAERGREMEAEALAWFAFDSDIECERVGFVQRDDEMFGGSPDALAGDDGGVEIKCPALHTHCGYLLDPGSLVQKYRGQVQSYLYLTGRSHWYVVSYNPTLPAVVQRVGRDEQYIAALETGLARFLFELNEAKERLAEHKQVTVAEALAAA